MKKVEKFINEILSDSCLEEALQENQIDSDLQSKIQAQRNFLNSQESERFRIEIKGGLQFFNLIFHYKALVREIITIYANNMNNVFCEHNTINRRMKAGDYFSWFFETKKILGQGAFGRVLKVFFKYRILLH